MGINQHDTDPRKTFNCVFFRFRIFFEAKETKSQLGFIKFNLFEYQILNWGYNMFWFCIIDGVGC